MADSWSQIDDDGVMMDWSALAFLDIWHPMEALRRACNERTENFVGGGSSISPFLRLGEIYAAESAIYDAINVIISRGAPHWATYSNLDNMPVTTEASILARIGDASRVLPSRLGSLSFVIQSYKILNELRWVYDFMPTTGNTDYRYGQGASWAAAESDYAANSWTAYLPGSAGYMAEYDADFATYYKNAYRFSFDITSSLEYAWEAWAKVDANTHHQPMLGITVGDDKMHALKSGTKTGSGATQSVMFFEDADYPASALEPTLPKPQQWAFGYSADPVTGYLMVLKKFDGANGFKFNDW